MNFVNLIALLNCPVYIYLYQNSFHRACKIVSIENQNYLLVIVQFLLCDMKDESNK